jgi:acetate kinase
MNPFALVLNAGSSSLKVCLYQQSGGGEWHDGHARADYFVYRAAKEIGALAASLSGLDGLVFTAGIGENAPEVRKRIMEASAWLGIVLDAAANASGGPRISTPESRVSAWVIPTNEEAMIARHTRTLLGLDTEQGSQRS